MNLANRGRSWGVYILAIAAVLLLSASVAYAQRTTGTLRGQVLDPSGAVVPDAKVTATSKYTGVSLTITTTSAGTYIFPSLVPGAYTVTVEAQGFKKVVESNVPVLADQENVADAKLELGTAAQTVEVIAGAVEVQTTTSTLGDDYDFKDVGLPNSGGTLNGSPLNLAVLSANVIAQPGGVTGIGGSVGGTRPRENNFVVDGVDDNNLGVTGPNSTVIPDAVGEFVLLTNQFSAEYGHSAGGQFITVTKTGTNNWHGSGEWYAQNRNFNSLDNLTKSGILSGALPGQPAYDNNRFGGTGGGPIIKDKLFVFGAYEYTTLHGRGSAASLLAPTAGGLSTLQGMAADAAVAGVLKNFPVAPANDQGTIPVNGAAIPIGNLTIVSPVFQREHDLQFNTDYTRGKHQFGTRFTFNQEKFINPVNSTQAVYNQNELVRNRKIALTDAWTINDHVVNDLRVQYSYFAALFVNPCTVCPPDVTLADLGDTTIGPGDNQGQKQNSYQLKDNLSWSRGKHTFKFGGEYTHFIYPQFFLPRSNGDNWYDTTQFLVKDLVPENVGRTLRNAGTGGFLGTQSLFAVFAQDDFKFSPRLTLNLGVRYEYWTNPLGSSTQALNAISNVPGVITFADPKTDKNNIGPRIGLAWDPRGDGKTAVRAGFGMSYGVKFQNFVSITLPPQLQSEMNETSACGAVSPPPAWCTNGGTGFLANGGLPQKLLPPTTQAAARGLTTSYIDDTTMPKIMNWTLGVQHELRRNTTVEVRYLSTRGLSLPVQYRRNRHSGFDAGLTPLPEFFRASDVPASFSAGAPTLTPWNAFNSNIYAPFGFLANVTADPPFGSSTYHAGSVSFKQRARYGLTFNANYTWAHTQDNATNEFFTSLLNPRRAQDTTQLRQDWSSSDLDVRHKFVLAAIFDVPKTKAENSFLKAVLNGYELSTVYLAQAGQPVTLQSGSDANRNGDSAGDRVMFNSLGTNHTGGSGIVNVCAPTAGGATFTAASCGTGNSTFGYLAADPTARYVVAGRGVITNVGRNSINTPGFGTLNLSVGKRTFFGEGRYLEVRADIFNVVNHPSFSLSNGNVFSNAGVTTATTTPGYAQPLDPNFLKANVLFSGGARSITLVGKIVF